MITVLLAGNHDKVREIFTEILQKEGNIDLYVTKQANVVKIANKDEFIGLVSLDDKIIELEKILYRDNKGRIYKCILELIERPLFDYVLKQAEGNQLKAAKVLGINRNTLRAKIKKLGIEVDKWKL